MRKIINFFVVFVMFMCFTGCKNKSECERNGHKWENATCIRPKHCLVCDIEEGNPINHNEVIKNEVLSTCCDEGLSEGKYCSYCGITLVEQQKIAKVDHKYENNECIWCKKSIYSEGLEYQLIDGGYEVISLGTCTDTKINIPPYYNGLPVVSILGVSWFTGDIIEICIPNTVTYINHNSFAAKNNLENIIVAEENLNYKSIDGNLYSKDGSTLIYYAPGKKEQTFITPSCVKIIAKSSFSSSKYLKRVILTDNVIKIESSAFNNAGSHSINSVYIPKSVTTIEKRAFWESHNRDLIIYCEAYSKLDGWDDLWSDTVYVENEYGEFGLFQTFNQIYWGINNENYVLIDDIEYVLNLENNTALISRYIGEKEKVVIPKEIEYNQQKYIINKIGGIAFNSKYNLLEIELSENIIEIDEYAFEYCNLLTDVYYSGDMEKWCNIKFQNIFSNPMYTNTWNFEKNFWMKGENETYLKIENINIPDSIYKINNYQFAGFANILTINIPSSVTCIGEYAFYQCESLEYIEIPNYVEEIKKYAFANCHYMMYVKIPNSVKYIKEYAFSHCSSLIIYCEDYSKPDEWSHNWKNDESLTGIGVRNNEVYWGINSNNFVEINGIQYLLDVGIGKAKISRYLRSDKIVFIPEKISFNNLNYYINDISNQAFRGSGDLTIYFEATSIPKLWIEDIIPHAFSVYTGVNEDTFVETNDFHCLLDLENNEAKIVKYVGYAEHVEIPKSIFHNEVEYFITDLGERLFIDNHTVSNVIIPNGVKNIGDYSFLGCYPLKNVIIPSSVENIGNYAFSNTGINTIIFEENSNLLNIGNNAFDGCTGLESIVFPNTLISIGSEAFFCCIRLAEVIIPRSVTTVGNNAFSYCEFKTIYCEIEEKPEGWEENWNIYTENILFEVVWDYEE